MNGERNPRVGEYEIVAVLDRGGMGNVFKVRNVISDRIEAMKVLLPDMAGRQELAERFRREIKILASLDHPNIAALRTALSWDNRLVMIMEYVEGVTLEARLTGGPLPVTEAVTSTDEVLRALAYAHGRRIIHRDIKPGNIMLSAQGAVKLMDFGIARCEEDRTLTTTGTILGSLYYMSPEQVKGEPADERSDLYSLGVSLYEMVTGKRPFEADSNYSIMAAHVQKQPRPPIALRTDLPQALNEIILRAMAKDPAERFQSAEEFSSALRNLGLTARARPIPTPEKVTAPSSMVGGETLDILSRPDLLREAARTAPEAYSAPSGAWGTASTELYQSEGIVQLPDTRIQPPAAGSAQASVPDASVVATGARSRVPITVHRGLYVTLGALIVLVLLVGAGIYFPRTTRTQAGTRTGPPEPPKTVMQPQPAGRNESMPSVSPSPATQPQSPTADLSPQSSPVSSPAARNAGHANRNAKPNSLSQQRLSSAVRGHAETRNQTPALPSEIKIQPSTGSSGIAGEHAPPKPAPGPTATEAASAAVDRAQLAQLDHELDLLSSRAESVNRSLKTLAEAQRSQGLGPRGDILSSQQRMQRYLARAESALKNQDAADARKYLDLAEPEVVGLERFLGR